MAKHQHVGALLAVSLMLGLAACAPEEDGTPIAGRKPRATATPTQGPTTTPTVSPTPPAQNNGSGVDGTVNDKESPLPIAGTPTPEPTPALTPVPFSVQVASPRGIVFDGSGNAWVASYGEGSLGSVTRMGPTGEPLREVMVGLGPEAMAIDTDQNLWVANAGSTVDASGSTVVSSLVSKVTPAGVWRVDVGSTPRGLVLDGAGNLWVAASEGVVRVSLSNHATQSIATLDAGGIAFQGGMLWVTDRLNGRVSAYSTAGILDRSIQTGSRPGVVRASGAVLWVLNHAGNSVTRIDTAADDAKVNLDPGGASPADLAFDASGNAWVSVPGLGKVTKFAPTGAYVESRAVGVAPHGLAFAPDGKLWVTDRDANRVRVLTP